MNIRKVTELRDHLIWVKKQRDSEERIGFNMGAFVDNSAHASDDKSIRAPRREREDTRMCSTTACLAGHAAVMEEGPALLLNPPSARAIEHKGKDVLGLSEGEANHMFYGQWADISDEDSLCFDEASIDDAIDYLTKVIEERDVFIKIPITGEVR